MMRLSYRQRAASNGRNEDRWRLYESSPRYAHIAGYVKNVLQDHPDMEWVLKQDERVVFSYTPRRRVL